MNEGLPSSAGAMHPDRLFPADPGTRAIARTLYAQVRALPLISPHGHTDPRWFATNEPFSDPASLLLTPDHYITRMLYSQGVALEALGVPARDGSGARPEPRVIWRTFAAHYPLFRGTPTRLWLDWVLAEVFGIDAPLTPANADRSFERISERLAEPAYRPRALFERFGIEVLATTESPSTRSNTTPRFAPAAGRAASSAHIGRIRWSIRRLRASSPIWRASAS